MATTYESPIGTQGPTLPKITVQSAPTVPLVTALRPPIPLPQTLFGSTVQTSFSS